MSTNAQGSVYTKELNAFPNYGILDFAADILYTGEVWSWNFFVSALQPSQPAPKAWFRVFLTLDDHYDMPENLYSFFVMHNNQTVFNGPAAGVPHGAPFGGQFDNWVYRDYAIDVISGTNAITIGNTSATSATGFRDWIAVDRIELHIQPETTVTPEPFTVVLLGTGLAGMAAARRRRKSN